MQEIKTEEQLEKYSSAVTLSDMEMFIFPELLYGLVLANIMSPCIWAWREDKWFSKIDKMNPYRRVLRLKQFIIDKYEFNLDLDTWGLTTQERELARFSPWIDEATLAESNALFGYEGDKYYFDIDIRRHFGLDKYTSNTIPYWKTETVEAMDAFKYREGYSTGAGECVSLSTLYAAALFVICKIPLEDIYLIATPLHSQNFIALKEGILTNNRRIVTKKMWFNGTELTAKGQRALRNEQVTIVCHHTGYVHVMYPEATIDQEAYGRFRDKLKGFLTTSFDMEILANFLRQHSELQSCFQVEHLHHGRSQFIPLEKLYHHEQASPYKVQDKDTRVKLLEEIDEYEFFCEPIEGRILLNKFEGFFREHSITVADEQGIERMVREFDCQHDRAGEIMNQLIDFVHVEPRLPDANKAFTPSQPIELSPDMDREDIMAYLESIRDRHTTADLAFYAYRDLSRTKWEPFLKAAVERNPSSIAGAEGKSDDDMTAYLAELPNESIYDGPRLAQPDEVWNYGRGDGLEKAICLANIWKSRHPEDDIQISAMDGQASIKCGSQETIWPTAKGLAKDVRL